MELVKYIKYSTAKHQNWHYPMEIGRAAKLPFNTMHNYIIQHTCESHQFQNQ